MMVIPEYKDPVRQRLDLLGMIAFSISMFSLVLAIIKGEDWGWGSAVIILLFVVAAAFLAIFIFLERWQSQPMLNMEVFRNITFSSSVICQAVVGFAMIGALFLLTLFLQNVLGYSALKAAIGITPIPASALVFAPISGRMCDKIGTRIPTIFGLAILGLGVWLFSQLNVDSGWGAVAWRAAIAGAGIGLSNPALAVAAMGAGIGGKEGVSSGVLNASRFVGMTIGVAVFTALLTRSINTQLIEARSDLKAIVTENQQIPSEVKVIILKQVELLGEGESMQTAPDLAALAKARGVPEALLSQLEQLTQQITSTIRGYLTNAFNDVFPWAAGIAFISIIPALFIGRPREESPGKPAGV